MTFLGVVFTVLFVLMLCGQISLWSIIKATVCGILMLFALALCVASLPPV